MIILQGQDITVSFGERVLFKNVTFGVDENDKIGLAGLNGAGKSTFFRLLAGAEFEDSDGRVHKSAGTKIGFMEQHVLRDESVTVYDEALSVFEQLLSMEQQLELLHERLDGGDTSADTLERQMNLTERYQSNGGLTFRARTESMLVGMGFDKAAQQKQIAVLSGGERSKVQLVKLLLSGANLLLLDEPTNHLDIAAAEWLEGFLLDFGGAYIVISHDRYFLDRVTNRTFSLDYGTLTAYKGNYTEYLRQYDEQVTFLTKKYNEMTEEIHRIEGIIAQQKRFNQEHNYVTIRSKEKQIERIRAQLVPPPPPRRKIRFQIPCREAHGTDVITANGLSCRIGERVLFRNASFEIKHGERIFLLGSNGCGKSTLMKMILGKLPEAATTNGKAKIADWLKCGYFDQLQEMRLTSEKPVIDYVWDDFPKLSKTQVHTALAMFKLVGEQLTRPVNTLSGGEAAKIVLLKIMLDGPNLLLLDEPTNHLDLEAREALLEALSGYSGTMLIISHDRHLINSLATKLMFLHENGVELFEGSYDDWRAAHPNESAPREVNSEEKPARANNYKQQKEQQAVLRRLKATVRRLESEIEKNDAELEQLNLRLAENPADYEQVMSDTERLSELSAVQSGLLSEWETAAAELEKIDE